MDSTRAMSVRFKLTVSYAALVLVAGAVQLLAVWVFLLRYVPDGVIQTTGPFVPNRSDLIRAFAPAAVWAVAFLLVVGVVGGWLLAGRMLAPLGRITSATRQVASGSLSHRIGMRERRDEFGELADSFDGMIAQIEAHVNEQRRFAANAAHELRTPLAATQAMLEVGFADGKRDVEELLVRLRAVNARAIEVTESLLLLSRVDGGTFTRQSVDLSLAVEETLEGLIALADRRDVSVEIDSAAAVVMGSPALLEQVARNLIHNAIVHNLPGGHVSIATAAAPPWAVLRVENSGDAVPPATLATLTEPFERGGRRTYGEDAGVGLGLAIVTSIVAAHEGVLSLSGREGGGMVAVVRLPLAAS